MSKKILLNLLKFIIAAALLWWLAESGKIDWKLIKQILDHPGILALVIPICALNLGLITIRIRHLLKSRTQALLSLRTLYLITWIGMFFSSVLPGSVTGDIIKVWYLKKQDKNLSTAFLVFVSFLDRVMGLTGLVLLMGFFSLINYSYLISLSSQMSSILHFNFILVGLVVVTLIVFFIFPQSMNLLIQAFPQNNLSKRLLSLWSDLQQIRKKMFIAIAISVLVQFLGVVSFHFLVSAFYTSTLSLTTVLSFIPLGFMIVAIPISPGGLGVGHAAFQTLFSFVGETNGANLFNIYFVVTLCFNLLGAIPWLILKKESHQ
jgi:glycosyltransferase 2 family protein